MGITFLGPLIEVFSNLGGKFLERQMTVSQGKIDIAKARAEAQASVQVDKARAELNWEQTMAEASANSWKDEAWTIFFITILFAAFIPGMEGYIKRGFDNIALLPDWFGTAVLLAIGAAFGKNIVKDVTSLKK